MSNLTSNTWQHNVKGRRNRLGQGHSDYLNLAANIKCMFELHITHTEMLVRLTFNKVKPDEFERSDVP